VSAGPLSQALCTRGLQVKAVAKRRPQHAHQDYDITDAADRDIATVTAGPPSMFKQRKEVLGFDPVPGLGQEAFWRPGVDQLCARGAKTAACLTLMPMAFPKDRKSTMPQPKAALQGLI
jgi:hypothetical protein